MSIPASVVIASVIPAPGAEIQIHGVPRKDARRVMSARQLHEAADMAEKGIPIPRTTAHEKLRAAMAAGDFARANALREEIKAFAPEIRAAAITAANGTRQRMAEDTARKVTDVQPAERARVKRERKSESRKRAQDAMMRSAARRIT